MLVLKVFNFGLIAISPIVLISAFLLSLQTVLWDPMLLRPSPKVICPALTFQGFRHVVQGSSSGVAAPAPFKAALFILLEIYAWEGKGSHLSKWAWDTLTACPIDAIISLTVGHQGREWIPSLMASSVPQQSPFPGGHSSFHPRMFAVPQDQPLKPPKDWEKAIREDGMAGPL